MASIPQLSVLVVVLGLQISSVISDTCYDNPPISYYCSEGPCCNGGCCAYDQYCCGTASCCANPIYLIYPTYPTYELTTGAIVGIIVGSLIIGIALIAGIIALCCMCCKQSRRGHVMSNPPQYAQQPYVVNAQYDQTFQQPYPAQVHIPTTPQHQPQVQPAAYIPPVDYQERRIPPVDYQERRQPERPRRHHSIPRAQY